MTHFSSAAFERFDDTIERVRSELQTSHLVVGFLLCVGAIASMMLGLFLLDNGIHFSSEMREFLSPAALLLAAGLVALFFVRPLLRPPSRTRTALAIQERHPDLQERPVNTVQICDEGNSSPFVQAMVEETNRHLEKVDISRVADQRRTLKAGAFAGAVLAILSVYGFGFSSYFSNAAQRFLHPSREIGRVGAPRVKVTPGDTALTIGDDLMIKASVIGANAEVKADLLWRSGGEDWRSCAMEPLGNELTRSFLNVRSSFSYQVRAGKSYSEKYQVKILPVLGIRHISLDYDFPPYTRLSARKIEDSDGRIEALAGTVVSLHLTASRPIASAVLIQEDLERKPLAIRKGTELQGRFAVQNSGHYSIQFRTEKGIASGEPITYPIIATPDSPPQVELNAVTENHSVSPSASLPLQISIQDDFGIGRIALKIKLEDEDWKEIKHWEPEEPSESLSLDYPLELGDWELKPGSSIALLAESSDRNNVTGPGIGASDELIIEIKDTEGLTDEKDETFSNAVEAIAKLVELQGDNLEQTRDVYSGMGAEGQLSSSVRARLQLACRQQSDLRKQAIAVLKFVRTAHPSAELVLQPLTVKEMVEAVRALESIEGASALERRGLTARAMDTQEKILKGLKDLLSRLSFDQHTVRIQDILRDLKEIKKEQSRIRKLTPSDATSCRQLAKDQGVLRPKMKTVEFMLDKLPGSLKAVSPELFGPMGKIARDTRARRIPAEIVQAESFLQVGQRKRADQSEALVLKKVNETMISILTALAENAGKEKEKLAEGLKEVQQKAEKLAALEKKVRKHIESLSSLDKDHLKEADKKKIAKLAEFQERAAQAAATTAKDLDKLPKSEFTGDMVKEFESITKELEMTAELLKEFEEQEVKEKCEECTEKIMKSLMKVEEESKDGQAFLDKKQDKTKYDLKDIPEGEMPDLPTVDLPDKLTDMVGNLIEKQEDQNEDTNDKSSNWAKADSKAGVPKEGPVSSFGGKGKTGNHRPDPTEISGRGGAGRTGQSSGELIEGATKNLDGDPTPARRTPDPVQAGDEEIEDNDPKQATATGGGKTGGAGEQGMAGRPNDDFGEDAEELRKMAENQKSLQASAQQLESTLKSLHLPAWTLPDAVRFMSSAGEALRSSNLTEAQEKQKLALQALKMAYQSMKGKPYVRSEGIAALPPELKRQIIQAGNEKFPPDFKDLLQRYYQEISDRAAE